MLTLVVVLISLLAPASAFACGGLFCQSSPVDQNAERIIFTQNGDGTVTALVEIQYTGSAPDFSWILPIPSAISDEDLAVPETGVAALDELEINTTPNYIPPPLPEACAIALPMEEAEISMEGLEVDDVTVFASGEVGPFSYDVIGSEDDAALINWLRDNDYMVTQEMEPLIDVYVQEEMAFLAMRLLPDEDVDSIKPIEITYQTDTPMIPLRLTAVAANPDMRVLAFIYADQQAVPTNYEHVLIPDEDIRFTFNGNNYRQLVGDYADNFDGKAFVTEYAQPTSELFVNDPYLAALHQEFGYVTRLSTVISPEEMTVDPVFDYDPQAGDISNIHDLTYLGDSAWDCPRIDDGQQVEPPPVEVETIPEQVQSGGEVRIQTVEPASSRSSIVLPIVLGSIMLLSIATIIGVLAIVQLRKQ